MANLVYAGVIDPTKVMGSALQNAASIASLLLTTEAVISQIPEEHTHAPMSRTAAWMRAWTETLADATGSVPGIVSVAQ